MADKGKQEIQVAEEQPTIQSIPAYSSETSALVLEPDTMKSMMELAEFMAKGRSTIPDHLKNPADCMAILMQSMQWKMNPYAVAQKTFLVSGKLGYEAQLVNAVVTSIAPVKSRINYEWFGPWEQVLGKFEVRTSTKNNKETQYRVPKWTEQDEEGCGVRVWATFKGEEEPRMLELLLTQAKVRNSTLWADDPKQQLSYLAVKRWARLHCPDVIMGVYTPDELEADQYGSTPAPRPQPKAERGTESALEYYPDLKFDENLPKWKAAIEKGKKADDVINTIKSRFLLTDEQEDKIKALEVKPEGDNNNANA